MTRRPKRPVGEGQLGLFGGGDGGHEGEGVGGAAARAGAADRVAANDVHAPEFERWARLAERLPAGVRLGTSSWTFPGWTGFVYRRRYATKAAFTHESLREYAAHPLFRCVSLDRGYYAPVPLAELAAYRGDVPEGFRFLPKVWSEIVTRRFPQHPRLGERAGAPNPHFLDAELFERHVGGPLREGLGAQLGPVLLELPPAPGAADGPLFLAALDAFLARARVSGVTMAVELRDPRLLTPAYAEVLGAHGATHVHNYWSRMPALSKQAEVVAPEAVPFVVMRLMLPPGRKYAALKEAWAPFDRIVEAQPVMRADTVALVGRAAAAGKDVYVVVNNKAEGSAPLTVAALAEALAPEGRLV